MTAIDAKVEVGRRAALVAAEKRAETLFDEIEKRGLLQPGRTEREVERDIYAIALNQFGVEKHWHKRIVRAGANTLTIAADNPPVRSIEFITRNEGGDEYLLGWPARPHIHFHFASSARRYKRIFSANWSFILPSAGKWVDAVNSAIKDKPN